MNKKISLTKELLDLVLLIQSYRQLITRENNFFNTNKDWYSETMNYYNSIRDETLNKIGVETSIADFERVLYFNVTDEMLHTNFNELDKFEFDKYQ